MSPSPIDNELQELKSLASHLRLELQLLTNRIDILEQKNKAVPKVEIPRSPNPLPETKPATIETPAFTPPPPKPPPVVLAQQEASVSSILKKINRGRPELAAEPSGQKAPDAGIEERIGKIWLNRIGAIILLLGIAFFVKYSFDQGLISPSLRVCMGGATGMALIAIGEYSLRKDKRPFAAGLLGAGVAVLYFSAFAAHTFYHLISTQTAFALLCGVTMISSLIAVHGRMLAIAIMGLVGGLWTPIALSTGVNQQVALMTYLLVLDIGFLVVGSIRRWDVLRLLCWLGSAGMFVGWYFKFYSVDALYPTLGFLTAFYLVFLAETVVSLRFHRAAHVSILPGLVHVNNAAFFASAYFLAVGTSLDPWLGLFCVVTATVQILVGWRGIGDGIVAHHCRESFFLDGAAILALAAPIQFDRYFVPVSWGAQAAVTLFFCRRNSRPLLRLKAVAILSAALVHLIRYDMAEPVLAKTIASVGHWNLNWITVLFVGLGLFAYLGAACLAFGRTLNSADSSIAGGLVLAGSAVMLGIWAHEYERYLAAWWWLGLAGGWWFLARRVPFASVVFCLLVLASCGKFMGWDTVAAAQNGSWAEISGIVLNRAVLTGLLVCLATILATRLFRRSMNAIPEDSSIWQFISPDDTAPILVVLAALTFTWTGTFEIARIFSFEPWGTRFKEPHDMGSVAITAFWAIHAAILWLLYGRRSVAIAWYALVVCFIATLKFVSSDTQRLVMTGRWSSLEGLCSHRVFVVGLITVAAWYGCCAMIKRWPRLPETPLLPKKHIHRMLVWGAILTIWLPTFEILRAFRFEPFRERFADPSLAMHVALSVFWSVFAVVVLGIGFARLIAPLRYLAIALFGMTVVKVFIVDLSHLEMIYRIVSFIVLGVLLLAASFLYQQLSARLLEATDSK